MNYCTHFNFVLSRSLQFGSFVLNSCVFLNIKKKMNKIFVRFLVINQRLRRDCDSAYLTLTIAPRLLAAIGAKLVGHAVRDYNCAYFNKKNCQTNHITLSLFGVSNDSSLSWLLGWFDPANATTDDVHYRAIYY